MEGAVNSNTPETQEKGDVLHSISVIVPNYNGKHFLGPCLDALRTQSISGFETIVVDNGSKDGSTDFIRENYPEVRLIALPENTGFCGAVNAGVSASKAAYVLLLNNDTVPEPRFVEELARGLAERPKAFSCAACMLSMANPELLDGAGDLYSALGWAFARGKGEPAKNYQKPDRIFTACAGAAIYRRELFVSLGMLDQNHFAYLEDMDIGYRARIRGYENWYIPSARVLHVGSGTTGSAHNAFKVTHSSRNNVYMIYKNMPLPQRILNAPFLLAGFSVKTLFFTRKGLGKIYREGLKRGRALAKSEEGRLHRQPRSARYFGNYCRIQLELWANLFRRRQ